MSYLIAIINKKIRDLINGFPAVVGIGFKDLKSNDELYINGDRKFLTASVFKIFVLIEFYNQVIKGLLNPEERVVITNKDKVLGSGILKELDAGLQPTLRDLAKLMIVLSDNVATDIIMKLVGMENINRTIHDMLGLKKSKVCLTTKDILFDIAGANDYDTARKNLDEMRVNKGGRWETDLENNNVTTPKEISKTLELLYRCKILTPQICEEILGIMKTCQTGEARIKRYLPYNVKVAHKTGTMPGVVNDVGIVFTDKGDYILVVFINGLNYESLNYVLKGEELIANVSREIYEAYITYYTTYHS